MNSMLIIASLIAVAVADPVVEETPIDVESIFIDKVRLVDMIPVNRDDNQNVIDSLAGYDRRPEDRIIRQLIIINGRTVTITSGSTMSGRIIIQDGVARMFPAPVDIDTPSFSQAVMPESAVVDNSLPVISQVN